MSSLPPWSHLRHTEIARRLLAVVTALGLESDYREEEWTLARIDAANKIKLILTGSPHLVDGNMAGALVRRTHALVTGSLPESDSEDHVLNTLASLCDDFGDQAWDLFDDAKSWLSSQDGLDEDEKMPHVEVIVSDWAPIKIFKGRVLSITGESIMGPRDRIVELIEKKGANWVAYPAEGANVLVLGTFGVLESGLCYRSGKLKQILEREVRNVRVVHECQIVDSLLS
jgi:hypothetical protein